MLTLPYPTIFVASVTSANQFPSAWTRRFLSCLPHLSVLLGHHACCQHVDLADLSDAALTVGSSNFSAKVRIHYRNPGICLWPGICMNDFEIESDAAKSAVGLYGRSSN